MQIDQDAVEKFLNKFGQISLIVPLKERNKSETSIPVPARSLKPENVVSQFGKMNSEGDYALYFLVNESNHPEKRLLENIVRCRAVWIEDDTTGDYRTDFPVPPNIVVNSSIGKYHYYWLTSTTDTEMHQRVMQRLVDDWNCDPNARDISRVMRIPGTYNLKGSPFQAQATYIVDSPYQWETILDVFPPAEVIRKINHNERGEFDKSGAEDKIKSSENYHETLRDLAMSYANKKLEREDIADLLRMKMEKVPENQRDERWANRIDDPHIYECVDSALKKIESEGDSDPAQRVFDLKAEASKTPTLEKNTMLNWPEPWPEIWRTYSGLSYDVVEPLLIPTIISSMSYMLGGHYRTGRGRRPQFMFLNLCPSTGNKDTNSKNILRELAAKIRLGGIIESPYYSMLSFNANITADTSFLQSFDDKGNLFWLNTEATNIYHQLKNSANNSNVQALSGKMIEVVDGFEISGKSKAGQGASVATIHEPNCQVIFYAQPETIERYLDETLIDSGLFGRSQVSIIEDIKFDPSTYSMVKQTVAPITELSEDFMQLIVGMAACFTSGADPVLLPLPESQVELLHNWTAEKLFPYMESGDGTMFKLLDRTGLFAEQLYTVILGVCQIYDRQKAQPIRTEIDSSCMIPLLEYWTMCKMYSVANLIETSADPLMDEILGIIEDCVTGSIKLPGNEAHVCKTTGFVAAAQITRVLRSRPKVHQKLNLSNQKLGNQIQRSLTDMASLSLVVEQSMGKTGKKKYYGIPAE